MLQLKKSRGWNGDDTGANINYYLYTGDWYRTLSPYYWNVSYAIVIGVYGIGSIYGPWANNSDGGVLLVLELC